MTERARRSPRAREAAAERTASRRQQVLDAAAACFTRSGFHGASMAEIAKAADISAGHIYNLFENKEDIISAIVQQEQDEMHAVVGDIEQQPDVMRAMVERAIEGVHNTTDPERAGLRLEVVAEASRNARMAEIVQAADAQGRERLRAMMLKAWGPNARRHSKADVDARIDALSAIFDGLTVRTVRHPQMDKDRVAKVVGRMIRALMED
ncbi:MAG: TetR family transcriptional regulator [Aquabacterium sp.]|jgi:AcrR family transcriptional regulator|nr:MAG: TetR family transcriptional regulator [Aquabacterium sp.]TAL21317.1 MAG: TetR family transcriptional regulator [Aquabacterium sp.]